MQMMKKSQLWISAVLYVLIVVVVIVIVMEALTPVIENMKDKAIYARVRDTFMSLNQYIRDVGSEGKGSQRTLPVEIQKGTLKIADNQIEWSLDTESSILEPRTQVELGNLIVVANGDVDAYETNETTFVLRNSNVLFEFYKFGSLLNFTNTTNSSGVIVNYIGSSIIKRTAFLKGATQFNITPAYAFFVPPDTANTIISGYTYLPRTGANLGKANVLAHINTTNYEYDIVFTLESQADYLQVDMVKGFK